MEKEYEYGVGAGEEGSILIIWQCYLETSPIQYAPICKFPPCKHGGFWSVDACWHPTGGISYSGRCVSELIIKEQR